MIRSFKIKDNVIIILFIMLSFIFSFYIPFFVFLPSILLFDFFNKNTIKINILMILFFLISIYFFFNIEVFFIFIFLVFIPSLIIFFTFLNKRSINKTFFLSFIYFIILGCIAEYFFYKHTNKLFANFIIDNMNTNEYYLSFKENYKDIFATYIIFFKKYFYAIFSVMIFSTLSITYKLNERIFCNNLRRNNNEFFLNMFFRPNEYYIYFLIINLLLIAIFKQLHLTTLILENILILIFTFYSIVGFFIISYFLSLYRINKFIFILILFFIPYILTLLFIIGIIDVFYNFRFKRGLI